MSVQETRQELRARRRAQLGRRWGPVAVAVAAPLLALLIGTDLPHALLIGAVLAAAALVSHALPLGNRTTWPVLPYGRRAGARRDVSSLTWTLIDRSGTLSSTGEQRLHAVLTSALELRGVDPTTPTGQQQAGEIFGTQVARWLSDPQARAPDPRTVRRIIARALETDPPTRTKGTS